METQEVQTVDHLGVQVMLQVSEKVIAKPAYVTLLQLSSEFQQRSKSIVVSDKATEEAAADSLKAIREALRLAEMLRKEQVDFPAKFCKVVNGMFKEIKDALHSAQAKLKREIGLYRDKVDAEHKAAVVEAERQRLEQEQQIGLPLDQQTCNTCASADKTATPWECGVYAEGKLTIVHDTFTCPKWNMTQGPMAIELPDEAGEPVKVDMEPSPPPPPPDNVTKGESGTVYTKKEWDYEITDFEKLVRSIGNKAHPELVAEDLLELKRGSLLEIIRRAENPVRRIAGLKIKEKKVVVGR